MAASAPEPSDEVVEALIAANPNGMTLESIAEVMGITKQRAGQLVDSAVIKAQHALRRSYQINSPSDLLPD